MILQRLKQYIDAKGLTIASFEKSIGMSNASFGKSLKKNGGIGTDKLENILSVYSDINPAWLLTGEGEMIKKDTTDISVVKESITSYRRTRDEDIYYKMYKEKDEEVKKLSEEIGALKVKLQEAEKKIEYYQALTSIPKESNPEPESPITRPPIPQEKNPHISKTFGSVIHAPGGVSSNRPNTTK